MLKGHEIEEHTLDRLLPLGAHRDASAGAAAATAPNIAQLLMAPKRHLCEGNQQLSQLVRCAGVQEKCDCSRERGRQETT